MPCIMPSIARLLPLLGENYERKCIDPELYGARVKSKRPTV
jgi:hypothetical protein